MRQLMCAFAVLGSAVAAAEAQPPAAWVTVSGQVVLPPGVPVPVPKAIPGPPPGLVDESVLVNPTNRGVRNVVVWLRPDSPDSKAKLGPAEIHPADARRPAGQAAIAFHPRVAFEPRICLARPGDTVVVGNLAAGPCNFFCQTDRNGDYNVVIPPAGAFRWPAPLVAETAPIPLRPALAPAAVCYLRVYEHPYAAVTDGDGRFELRDAPVGAYRLVVWHERNGFKDGARGRFGDPIVITPGKGGRQELPPIPLDVTR